MTGTGTFPLSAEQRTVWLHSQTHEDPCAYMLSVAHRLTGPLDPAALRIALDAVIARNEALRTGFRLTAGGPVREVRPPVPCPVTIDEAHDGEDHDGWMQRVSAAPFDLGRPPLLRAHVRLEGPDRAVLLILVHHLVFDGWSVGVLLAELSGAYRSATGGGTRALPPPVPSRRHTGEPDPAVRDANARYWAGTLLSGRDAAFAFDGAHTAPARLPATPFALGTEATEAVTRLAELLDTTRFVVVAALVTLALSRLHGARRVVLGYPVADRGPEAEHTIGLFLNTLALAVDVRDDMSFGELAEAVEDAHFDALEHSPLEGDRVVAASATPRDRAGTPLFSVLLAFQNVPPGALDLPGVTARRIPGPPRPAEFDLTLAVEATEPRLAGQVERDGRAVGAGDVRRLLSAVEVLAARALDDPKRAVGELSPLSAADRRLIGTEVPAAAGGGLLHALVEHRAAVAGDGVALIGGGRRLSLTDVDTAASALAARLAAAGIGRGRLVGVAMGRSPEMVVALLGVLKAGAAYVPLDPAYPADRLRLMVEDCRPAVILADTPVDWPDVPLWTVDLDTTGPADVPDPGTGPDDPAYVIYTSGSTGRPKGVVIPHRAAVNVVRAFGTLIGCGPEDVFHAVTSISFDIALLELFWPLSAGAQVRLGSPHTPGVDGTTAGDRPVTHFQCTPSLATSIAADPAWRERLRGLKHFLLGGEPVRPDLVRDLRDAVGGEIYNVYGPTEATVWSNARRIEAVDDAALIGRPLPGCAAYVLDSAGRLVPPGVRGELCLGGVQLATGYLDRPELTAERFVTGWSADLPGVRLYRTGDVVSLGGDGLFRFHGRSDDQVKLRGHRIELGEVEAALAAHPQVTAAAVTVAGTRLAAFVTGTPADLLPFLRERLPAVMVPATVTVLDALPLTPNGKVDRRRLTAPVARAEPSGPVATGPLARIWSAVLNVPGIDPRATFPGLGGDSLSAIRAVAQARAEGITVSAADLLRGVPLADLVISPSAAPTAPAAAGQDVPLLPMQHDFFARPRPDQNWANLASLHTVDDPDAVADAFLAAAARHDALRLSFHLAHGSWRQSMGDHPRVEVATVAVTTTLTDEIRRQQRTLDITTGPLAKAVILRPPGGAPARVLLLAHHLVMDAWSFRSLQRETTDGPTPAGAPVSAWARQVAAAAGDAAVTGGVEFWESLGLPDVPPVPADAPRGPNLASSARTLEYVLNAEHVRPSRELLLTAFAAAYHEWSSLPAVAVRLLDHGRHGLPGHGPQHGTDLHGTDLHGTVGWLSIDHPVVLPTRARTRAALLDTVHERLRDVPGHGYGWGMLRHLAAPDARRRMHALPAPGISVNYLGALDGGGEIPDGRFSPDEARGEAFQVIAYVRDGRLTVTLRYSHHLHREPDARALGDAFARHLRSMS
ncbi:non-ribosomal peptide synthetase [Actinoplanes rectilineatus]|uniref:non-ribosomal peptide synthetase n=1 Tax=Actinoplanes rectilineatus TaxID=113571 RepID=UPI0005F27E27|nr:non-ribosomal peptide synthetase [Actinoplanes rectilineatus]